MGFKKNNSMKLSAKIIVTAMLLTSLNALGQHNSLDFDVVNTSKEWNLVFKDKCTKDWTKKWTLDGLIATVENSRKGMHFSAGPEAFNEAHHAVMWTKESFSGDIKIEYDYTRTDEATSRVTILYIQATGVDCPDGASKGGWSKTYSKGTINWIWNTSINDKNPFSIYALFYNPDTYTVEVLMHSDYQSLDRFVMFEELEYTLTQSSNLSLFESVLEIINSVSEKLNPSHLFQLDKPPINYFHQHKLIGYYPLLMKLI